MKFRKALISLLIGFLILMTGCQNQKSPSKPNILLIMCDQFRFDRLGFMGDRVIQTPNLDALAQEGIYFTNAYCPSPVCSPSRAALKTGLFPPGNGVVTNWVPFKGKVDGLTSIENYLLPERLKNRGYETGMVGKLHFVPPEDSFGFDFKALHDAPYSVYAHDDQHSDYIRWLKDRYFKESGKDIVAVFDRDESYYPDSIYPFIMGSGWRTDEQHDIPWTVSESIKFLEDHSGEKPFFLFTSFFGPHQPYLAPSPWDTLYNPEDIDLDPRFDARLENSPIFQLNQGKLAGKLRAEWDLHVYKEVIAAYYGQISMIDLYLGKLFDILKEKNLWENTWIVFLADHGDFNGAYGIFFKGEMYDVSAKIPFIIKPAKGQWIPGKSVVPVNSIDIYGTILDIAGDTGWRNLPLMESKSLLPLLRNGNTMRENEKIYSIIGSEPTSNLCMLREGPLKIIRKSIKDQPALYELYDLDSDPYEIQNVSGKPEYREAELTLRKEIDAWWSEQSGRYPVTLDHSFQN
jgi:arylsulfatase A-like enzyme